MSVFAFVSPNKPVMLILNNFPCYVNNFILVPLIISFSLCLPLCSNSRKLVLLSFHNMTRVLELNRVGEHVTAVKVALESLCK